ncbi:hypothetical protein Tco_0730498 [Tanacetum coccineum]|uniref:Uncharacterized protein n=1 Tax=Tanacetum coccineum TaxID=301880 RepID=A0ABQ4YUN5_9ASTR
MERFENTIFKQCEEINGRMTEMFGLLKELATSKTHEKVLIREEAKFPVTKYVNSISLTKGEEGGSDRTKVTPDNAEKPTETETEMPVTKLVEVAGPRRKDKASHGEGDKVQPMEEQKFQRQVSHSECLELGPEYLTRVDDDEEVTLYLMRRSLEVLRKFYLMILGGRFNQLSHVSSSLLSKPGEY